MSKTLNDKKALAKMGIASLVLSVILIIGGVLMLVFGIPMIKNPKLSTIGIMFVVLAGISILLSLFALIFTIFDANASKKVLSSQIILEQEDKK